ncbi:hypothetical protein [Agrobacterium sp. DSM 25558]|uniref:hypothetical protein n=1 Tax=Agrobacterium sp. DSM 25558 TaxID=1907665 RepID=UPI001FCDAE8B|nr:hypothetical protein [Agrobacterium sp. DSM 25558]
MAAVSATTTCRPCRAQKDIAPPVILTPGCRKRWSLAFAKRTERLVEWEKAPAARAAHPREDHLIPLMVAVGAAEDEPGFVTYHQNDFAGGLTASSFRFGDVPSALN